MQIPKNVKEALESTKQNGYLFNDELDVIINWGSKNNENANILISEITNIIKSLEKNQNTFYIYDVYFVRGLVYELLENYQKAIDDFTTAQKFEDALFERGKIYYLLNDYEKALKDFNYAIRKNKDNGDYFYYRGLTYKVLGDEENATKDLQKALRMAKRGY